VWQQLTAEQRLRLIAILVQILLRQLVGSVFDTPIS
jgi:hypothetical protein